MTYEIDVALALHKLVPDARYSGSTYPDTEEVYDLIRWNDERPKPSFQEVRDLCQTVEFRLWKQRLMCLPVTRGEIATALRGAGILDRSNAVKMASGALPDAIYDALVSGAGEEHADAVEMAFASSSAHPRLSFPVDAIAGLSYSHETSIDGAYQVSAEA